jgi:hypothetical protein
VKIKSSVPGGVTYARKEAHPVILSAGHIPDSMNAPELGDFL